MSNSARWATTLYRYRPWDDVLYDRDGIPEPHRQACRPASGAARPSPTADAPAVEARPRLCRRVQHLHLLAERVERAVLNDADRRDTLTDNLGNFPII